MKKLILIGAASVTLASTAFAAPFMAIGDGAELFVTGMLGVRADDNIFLAKNATNDVIFDVNPGVDLTFGKNAQFSGDLSLVDAFANYSSNSGLDTQLFAGDFTSKYDDGKTKLDFSLQYHELNQNTVDIRGLTRRDVFTVNGDGEVQISMITSVGGGISYDNENYKRANYADSKTWTVPVNFYYKWTPKTDLSFGYQYSNYNTTIGSDSQDNFFNVGARGEFTEKLVGNVRVGLITRSLDHGGNENDLGLDATATYNLSPKTNLQFGASNNFGTSPQGAQQRNLTINASATTKLSEVWSVNAGVSYRHIVYSANADDYWEGTLGASYVLNSNLRFVGSYVYRTYHSPISSSDFDNNVFSLAANLRY